MHAIQRNGARVFTVNDQLDPKFGTAVRAAADEGVEVYAYSSQLFWKRSLSQRESKGETRVGSTSFSKRRYVISPLLCTSALASVRCLFVSL